MNRGSSSLMPVTGLSFFPRRVYSGPIPPKISVGKCESEARASGGCYVYFAWWLVVYCAGGGLLHRSSVVTSLQHIWSRWRDHGAGGGGPVGPHEKEQTLLT